MSDGGELKMFVWGIRIYEAVIIVIAHDIDEAIPLMRETAKQQYTHVELLEMDEHDFSTFPIEVKAYHVNTWG